jgi:hypothetical protein
MMRLRPFALAIALAAAACSGKAPALNALCAYCQSDGDCGGNPCFQDTSGEHFCGHPCGSCPAGFSCQPVTGSNGKVVSSCFPDSESCVDTVNSTGADAGVNLAVDLAGTAPPGQVAPIPTGGPIGAQGGTVDKLLFAFTGDTRPDRCGGVYPGAVIDNIYTRMKSHGVQFALDQGDHMFSCGSGLSTLGDARTQMSRYVSAAALLGKTVFMTMGNHECSQEATALCKLSDNGFNPNYTAFMEALSSVSDKPYYRFDVTTKSGLAAFIVVADDVWDATEKSWLETQLADADKNARYTFVSKHHPSGSMEHTEFADIYSTVTAHKYTLLFTGHSHYYARGYRDSRALIVGCGGAPLSAPRGTFWGYGIASQGDDDSITVTIYDQATDGVRDSFVVAPQ